MYKKSTKSILLSLLVPAGAFRLRGLEETLKIVEHVSCDDECPSPETPVSLLASRMRRRKLDGMAVKKDGQLVGIVTRGDAFTRASYNGQPPLTAKDIMTAAEFRDGRLMLTITLA